MLGLGNGGASYASNQSGLARACCDEPLLDGGLEALRTTRSPRTQWGRSSGIVVLVWPDLAGTAGRRDSCGNRVAETMPLDRRCVGCDGRLPAARSRPICGYGRSGARLRAPPRLRAALGWMLACSATAPVVWAELYVPTAVHPALVVASSPFWMAGVEALYRAGRWTPTWNTMLGLLARRVLAEPCSSGPD